MNAENNDFLPESFTEIYTEIMIQNACAFFDDTDLARNCSNAQSGILMQGMSLALVSQFETLREKFALINESLVGETFDIPKVIKEGSYQSMFDWLSLGPSCNTLPLDP